MVTKAERDAWSIIYKAYDEYAQQLRDADAEAAGELFTSALKKMCVNWNELTETEQMIIMAGYDLLGSVWKASHKE